MVLIPLPSKKTNKKHILIKIFLSIIAPGSRVHPDPHEDDRRVQAGRQPHTVHKGAFQSTAHLRTEANAPGKRFQNDLSKYRDFSHSR